MAFTPGSARAADVSMERMRACACGLRRTRPTSMPGSEMSAPNLARPVTLSTPSGRQGRVPTYLSAPLPLPISLVAVAMGYSPLSSAAVVITARMILS